jgi:hypothetical protein
MFAAPSARAKVNASNMTMKKPEQVYSFTSHAQNQPGVPLPGDRIDAQFSEHRQAITETQEALQDIRRDDGQLKNGLVTKEALAPDLVTDLTKDIRKDVALDVEIIRTGAVEARIAADRAASSAQVASEAAEEAKLATNEIRGGAGSALEIIARVSDAAQQVERRVENAAFDTFNYANDAIYARNQAQDYAVLSAHWAEYMPDTIPPNILAVMGITGEHWSSRWWAHRAGDIVREEIKELCRFFIGAYVSPPSACPHGDPLVPGTMYWNTAEEAMYVWTGDEWQRVAIPTTGDLQEFQYLSIAGQDVFGGVDIFGRTPQDLTNRNANVNVYLNGVRLLETYDWHIADSAHIRLARAPAHNSVVTVERLDVPQTIYAATAGKIDTSMWVFDGETKSFPIFVQGALFAPANAANVLVSLDGVMLDAGIDFTVSGTVITFSEAPLTDARSWGLVGMPLGPDEIRVLYPSPSTFTRFTYAATVEGQAAFGGLDKYGNALMGLMAPAANVSVHVNGVRVEEEDYQIASDVEIILSRGVSLGSSVIVEVFEVAKLGGVQLVPTTAEKIETERWIFNGIVRTFPVYVSGSLYAPPAEAGVFLSLDGLVLNPGVDFTISGTTLTFSEAPLADAKAWAVVGIPNMRAPVPQHNHDCGVFG